MKSQARYNVIIIILSLIFIACVLFIFLSPGRTQPTGQIGQENNDGEDVDDEDTYSFICPFDGMPLKEMPLRPVVVTIDNFAAARPQSGLSAADLVYEIPAEGGITRFLAVYFHGQAEKIGPIRSARPYLAAIAQDWQGVFIHAGESPQAQVFFKQEDLDHINEMFHSQGFWRDKSRKAPHNLYSSSENLWQEITKAGWNVQTEIAGFAFLAGEEDIRDDGLEVPEVTIDYPYGDVIFRHDSVSGLYQRFLGDKPQIDKETGKQLTAANVIVQETRVQAFDEEGRLEIDLVGEGRAWLFSGGRIVEGRWVNDGKGPTDYLDTAGNEFTLKPGQTWIEIVSPGNKVKY